MPAPKGHPPYNTNGEGGRPKIHTDDFIDKETDALIEWMKKKENLFIEDFAFERGYSYKRLAEWAKEHKRFAGTYETFHQRQKTILFKGGLSKKFAHPMCALILSHSHGIYAKTEQKLSGDSVNPLAFAITTVSGSTKDLVSE